MFKLPQPRASFGCAVKDQSLYIIGGKSQDRPLNTF